MSKFARRVDQLDAIYLDEELSVLLISHYRKAFQYLPNSIIANITPELDILFKIFYRYLPLHFLGSTFGQNLFQLQFMNNKTFTPTSEKEILILTIATVCIPWLWERVMQKFLFKIPDANFRLNSIDLFTNIEKKLVLFYKFLALVNFSIFLQEGKFSSLIERLLNIRLTYTAPPTLNPVSDDHLQRELLWYGLSELIVFTLPLINIHKIKGFFKRNFLTRPYKALHRMSIMQRSECAICGNTPNFPHVIGCSHVFCYYCIASIVIADPLYLCFDCNVKANGLESVKPLSSNQ